MCVCIFISLYNSLTYTLFISVFPFHCIASRLAILLPSGNKEEAACSQCTTFDADRFAGYRQVIGSLCDSCVRQDYTNSSANSTRKI